MSSHTGEATWQWLWGTGEGLKVYQQSKALTCMHGGALSSWEGWLGLGSSNTLTKGKIPRDVKRPKEGLGAPGGKSMESQSVFQSGILSTRVGFLWGLCCQDLGLWRAWSGVYRGLEARSQTVLLWGRRDGRRSSCSSNSEQSHCLLGTLPALPLCWPMSGSWSCLFHGWLKDGRENNAAI